MFQYFFTYVSDLPDGLGFHYYGIVHMLWLFAIAVFGFILIRIYQAADELRKKRIEKIVGILIVAFDLYKDVVLLATGKFNSWELPFDLCGLAVFFCCIHAFTHSKTLGQILYFLCMPGAFSALLFPNWTDYPQLNYMNIHSFVIHGLLVIYPLMLVLGGQLSPRIRLYYRVWIFLIVLAPFEWILNSKLGTNFLFLRFPSKGSPLIPIYNLTGKTFYPLGLAALVLLVNMIMFLPFISRKHIA